HIPMEQLRDRIHELPRDKEIWTICGVGQRAYYATRLLMQHDILNLDSINPDCSYCPVFLFL
ncbi:MAG: hypothetical protein ABGX69_07525, partial [Methylococcales bacterium]